MMIVEWSDADFTADSEIERVQSNKQLSVSVGTNMHRYRQRAFYAQCLKTLKTENRTWTLLTDTDEHLALNTYTRSYGMDVESPGSITKFLNEASLNSTIEPQRSPCIMMPRLTYSSKESSVEQVSRGIPQGFNGSDFVTQRFRKHCPPRIVHGLSKTVIDVSRVDPKYISESQANPHRPIFEYCPQELLRMKVSKSPLVVRHYLGTWEQFSFRDDARKQDGMRTNTVRMRVLHVHFMISNTHT